MKKYYIIEKDGDIFRYVGFYEASSPHDALLRQVASRHATYSRVSLNRFFAAVPESLYAKLFQSKFISPSYFWRNRDDAGRAARKKPNETNKTYHLFRLHGSVAENLNKKYMAVEYMSAIYKLAKNQPDLFKNMKHGHIIAVSPDVYKEYKSLKFTKASDLKKEADEKYEEMYFA